ncbi:MAG: pilus assembly protein [Eubacteriales bacterium]|nr:pilus assembly protein [Eubacteriales bacterium]
MVDGWRKGSLTVEAACLMSLILFVVMGVLNLFFFVHNRTWLTAAAYEAALTGSMEAVRMEGEELSAAEEKGKSLGNFGFFGGEGLTVQASGSKRLQVVYDMDTIPGFGGFSWHLRAEGKTAVLRPVAWIRLRKAAAEGIKEVAGSS